MILIVLVFEYCYSCRLLADYSDGEPSQSHRIFFVFLKPMIIVARFQIFLHYMTTLELSRLTKYEPM